MFNGFVLIDKESDWTSRDVCNKLQSYFHTRKVGHTGTLDPFATGLLIVTVNNGNKVGSYLDHLEKEYIAELRLGIKTSTADYTGEKTEEKEVPNITKEDIEKVFSSLIGEMDQIPPMTSAKKVHGVKLYSLAHAGIEVEREPRKVYIKEIELINFINNIVTFRCLVSTGTYVRTLGEEIAERLNTVGHLISLRRTKIGNINVEQATKIANLNENYLLSIFDTLSPYMTVFYVDEVLERKAKCGAPIYIKANYKENEKILIANKNKEAIAIYEYNECILKCVRGLWTNESN